MYGKCNGFTKDNKDLHYLQKMVNGKFTTVRGTVICTFICIFCLVPDGFISPGEV